MSDKIEELLYLVRDRVELVFHDLFRQATSRTEIVVTFLALLELIRLKRLRVTQLQPFSEIHVVKVAA